MIATSTTQQGRLALNAAGHELYYEIHGSGPGVILVIHGGPGLDSRYMAGFTRLASAGLRVVLYDQLGHGRSDRPVDDSLWTMGRFVEDIEAVRTGLDLGPVHLIGHSWGGMLAMEYAVTYPDGLLSLVLSHCLASGGEILQACDAARSQFDPADYGRMRRHEGEGDVTSPVYADIYLRRIGTTMFRRSTPFDPETSTREFLEEVVPLLEGGGGDDPARVMWGLNEYVVTGNMADWDVSGRLGEIRCPTLVLGSWHDQLGPAYIHSLAERIPRSELVIFGRSGHMIMLEDRRDSYFTVVRDFMERQAA